MEKMDLSQTPAAAAPAAGLGLSLRHSLLPLLALFAGGLAGRVLAGVSRWIEPVKAALGPVFGPFVTAPDNLILGFGLFGLLLSYLLVRAGSRKGRTP